MLSDSKFILHLPQVDQVSFGLIHWSDVNKWKVKIHLNPNYLRICAKGPTDIFINAIKIRYNQSNCPMRSEFKCKRRFMIMTPLIHAYFASTYGNIEFHLNNVALRFIWQWQIYRYLSAEWPSTKWKCYFNMINLNMTSCIIELECKK